MVREGEKHAAADQEKRDRIEAVNQGNIEFEITYLKRLQFIPAEISNLGNRTFSPCLN